MVKILLGEGQRRNYSPWHPIQVHAREAGGADALAAHGDVAADRIDQDSDGADSMLCD
jgi:hypothetical protein